MKPQFITFTGADDHTSIDEMIALAKRYPIEFGILFSRKRQGADPRYPGGEAQSNLLWSGLPLAAHLCGAYSDDIMSGQDILDVPVDLGYFRRIQINHADPKPERIIQFRSGWGKMRCIAQTRGEEFPADTSVDWLYDASGGRGIAPNAWPRHPGRDRLVGYAGGINPDNVLAVVTAIRPTGPYWLDMESGVRTNNRFDLEKCRRVCELVFDEVSA